MEKVKNESVTQILNRIDNVLGCTNVKENLKLYSKYIDFKLKNKIDFGNYNIIINRRTGGAEYKEILNIVNDILINKKIVTDRYIKLKDNNIEPGIQNKLYIIEGDSFDSIVDDDLRDLIEKNSNNVFILLAHGDFLTENSKIFYKSMFYWSITMDIVSEDEKTKYIQKIISDNNFIIKENSKFPEKLKDFKIFDINESLMQAFVQANNKKDNILEDKYFKIEKSKENQTVKNTVNNGLEKLDKLIGLDSVKKQIHQIIDYMEIHKERGSMPMLHMVFTGNPRYRKNNGCENNRRNIFRVRNIE